MPQWGIELLKLIAWLIFFAFISLLTRKRPIKVGPQSVIEDIARQGGCQGLLELYRANWSISYLRGTHTEVYTMLEQQGLLSLDNETKEAIIAVLHRCGAEF